MTKEDKYLDEMLERLDGYKPPAEPDWDAFYKKNKKNISVKKSKGIVSKSTVRLTILVIAIVAVFTGGYFYMQSSSTTEENVRSGQHTTIPTRETETIDARQTNNPPAAIPVQELEIIPRSPAPVDNNSSGGIETIISDPNARPGQTKISGSIPEVGQTIINETITETEIIPKDSVTNEPVIIKQTVFIKDTIHVTRPIKKR
jgi:hypothetical protein